ncbi:solute:sodium symporter family transporter [Algoriphagus machipongonensis]|uniref:Transporter, solute:sodium symporter (SSS) family n=1 Tax=Algoriphagus machipongonensis TaxID=388413 RepID=A3I397_9BACT|nr:solute:sodium symporter family transporter [Algoriphagus machipongonensis]EAZ79123.1 transporter, solute:sodium symporter (SSS) family [Algoriphagus machipongonensis]
MTLTILSFLAFTSFVAIFSWYQLRKDKLDTQDGYFLGGKSLSGLVIAGSMLLTNISTEHLIGMNGSAYKNGFIIIAWEVTSAIALVIGALYFIPRFLKMGLTTIPQYLEYRFDRTTRTLVALFLIVSFVVTLLPIVLYTGAINLESIFNVSETLEISQQEGLWLTVIVIGAIGSIYAIFGGLKAVAYSDTINGIGLFLGGLLVLGFALWDIGSGNLLTGLDKVYKAAPEKFNVIGAKDSVLPFETLFTGLMINQLYFWCMNQTIIQRAFGAKNLAEAQKGLLYTGILKLFVPLIIILPGVIGFYYFGDSLYDNQDLIYPELIKKVLPVGLTGFFAAVVMGAVLSTFNSVLNSTATIFSLGIYKRHLKKDATDKQLVWVGKVTSIVLAICAIMTAPLVAGAPEGLYQLLQQLNGIFFIPIASIIIAGLFLPRISALGAKAGLFVGLGFYILTVFILKVDIHFVHIWGIEFLLNMAVMFVVSYFSPNTRTFEFPKTGPLDLNPWKYSRLLGGVLVILTVIIYIWLGQ